jgi:hypothetical protein
VRPVVSTHSIYRFRFFLLLLRRRRDWLLRADPPCRAAGCLDVDCLDAGCFVCAGFAADPLPEFPSDGGRNKSRKAPSGLDRVPVEAGSLDRGAGFGRSAASEGSTFSAGSAGAAVTSRFAGELLASIAPPFPT